MIRSAGQALVLLLSAVSQVVRRSASARLHRVFFVRF